MAPASGDFVLHPFHNANIHERRFAARLVRAVPIGLIVLTSVLVAVGVFKNTTLLLSICAVLNLAQWLFVSSSAMFGILGSHRVKETAIAAEAEAILAERSSNSENVVQVQHVIVFPNYEEDEAMIADTLRCIQEARGSKDFVVVLGMEEREGESGKTKAENLEKRFETSFRKMFSTYHPKGKHEVHLDGSEDEEVPGKASNLKWAVNRAHERCREELNLDMENSILTVADADCLFHPLYFAHLTAEFRVMRDAPGEQHRWTMWQAPQLPYRNYYISPAPSRVWGYISSIYEFGGVSSLISGGHHMVFSAYSVHLQLAVDAQLWDGDIIAEDHHAYIKGFFYSVHCSAVQAMQAAKGDGGIAALRGCRPALRVRPVMLPVKSTSVVSAEGYWPTWVARWDQAKRHCQGVSELSYSLLAIWDMLCTLPLSVYNLQFMMQLSKVVLKLFLMHTVSVCQAIALGVLTLYWVLHHRSVPYCPDRIWMASSDGDTLLCGLAGAWALTWPVMIPFALVAIANYRFIRCSFSEPKEESKGSTSLWHQQDGEIPPTYGSKALTLIGLIIFDCLVLLGPVMVPYGLFAQLVGCWNVLLRGNHFKYVTAAKMLSSGGPDYGTMPSGP